MVFRDIPALNFARFQDSINDPHLTGGPAHYVNSVSRAAMTLSSVNLLQIPIHLLNGFVPVEMPGAFGGSRFRSAHHPV